MAHWMATWKQLPEVRQVDWRADAAAVTATCPEVDRPPASELREVLRTFHPWRKGPFHLFGIDIDTEWRSNLKWDRIASAVDLRGKWVLDVGCGNGYYGWRMLERGAELVLGCDPFPLYWMQFEVLRRYAPQPQRHWLVPLADQELPAEPGPFDVTLSMGVLYHRPQPLEHLQRLHNTLRPGGQLLLETLIIDSSQPTALQPRGRYAKMKNVAAIPSLPLLYAWLESSGFSDICLVDVSRTTPDEQRRTEWMTFESLADFLDPHDPRLTIEGHPAPLRGVVTARRACQSRRD